MWVLLLNVVLIASEINFTNSAGTFFDSDIGELFENLIESLRKDPFLTVRGFGYESRKFVDEQVGRFRNILGENDTSSRFKREVTEDTTKDVVELVPYFKIPANFPKDLHFFQQNSKWYALSLESSSKESQGDKLIIKKFEDNEFRTVADIKAANGVRTASFPLGPTSSVIAVAENVSTDHLGDLYKFTNDEKFERIQTINTRPSNDLALWSDGEKVFMMLGEWAAEGGSSEVEIPLYEWHDTYFDVIQRVKARSSGRVSPFSIGDQRYLAIADSMRDEDNGKMYSEILKYDLETKKYEPFQRLLTNGCSDIKHFKIDQEDFLIVTNTGHATGGVSCSDSTSTSSSAPLSTSNIYKFVDYYFIPFQGVHLEGVSEWQPVTTENGDSVLLAPSCEGLRCLKHDGWRFQECKVNFTEKFEEHQPHPYAIRYEEFNGTNVLVLLSDNSVQSLYEVSIAWRNELEDLHHEMLSWCQDNARLIDNMNDEDILGDAARGDVEEVDAEPQGAEIEEKLFEYDGALSNIENELDVSSDSSKTIEGDSRFSNLILNNETAFLHLNANEINGIDMEELFGEALNINDGFEVNSANFSAITVENLITKRINGQTFDEITTAMQDLNIITLIVEGNAHFKAGLNSKRFNGAEINSKNILLTDKPQNIINFNVETVVVNSLNATKINGIKFGNKLVDGIETLNIKNLKVKGFVNDLNITNLYENALRIFGDQTVSKEFYFDHLTVDGLKTNTVSGVKSEEFVLINEGTYDVRKDINFLTSNVRIGSAIAMEFLNNIPVKNNLLGVLMKNASEEGQYVSGAKHFEDLELLNSIKMRGKIEGDAFDAINPTVDVEDDLVIEGDVVIHGDVRIENAIKAEDIQGANLSNSLRKVRDIGLRLEDSDIMFDVKFQQHINVDELHAEKINRKETSVWVVNGAKQPQIVTGSKKFLGDLEITGNTNIISINDIYVENLEDNILKIKGDQIVEGKHHIKYASIEKIITNSSSYEEIPLEDFVTINKEETIYGIVIENNLTANLISAGNIQVFGLVNNVNISQLISDVVDINNSNFNVFGHKTFENISIDNLVWKPNFDLFESVKNDSLIIKELSVDDAVVKNVTVEGEVNGKKRKDLDDILAKDKNEVVVNEDVVLDNMKVFGVVHVETGEINGVNIEEFFNITVKTDEPHQFEKAEFKKTVKITSGLALEGQIEHLDLETIFQNNVKSRQILNNNITFENDVSINGTAKITKFLNGVNFPKLCKFISPEVGDKVLVINGSAQFFKGPKVAIFNGKNVRKVLDTAWFTDKFTTINNSIEFKNDVIFEDEITIAGLFNDISIKNLSETYLSKTKHQHVKSSIYFKNNVTFENDVAASKLVIEGKVNGIDFNKFPKQVLLNRPQLFEDEVYFENCKVNEVRGEFTVNGLSLENDVMRYDVINKVTGTKIFENLSVKFLKINDKIKMHDVDVLHFLKNVILTTQSSSVTGKKWLKKATFTKELNIKSQFNGINFDQETILLSNTPQNITGKGVFAPEGPEALKLGVVQVVGLVNNVNIKELAQNQINKIGNINFKFPVNFVGGISTKNLNLEGSFMGINVSEVVMNLTHLESLNNFKKKYTELLMASGVVETSLKNRAFYLDDFELVQSIAGDEEVLSIGNNKLITVRVEQDGLVLGSYRWDNEGNFIFNGSMALKTILYPSFYAWLNLCGIDYFYVEQPRETIITKDQVYEGKLIHFGSNLTNFHTIPFETKGTIHLTTLTIKSSNLNCLIFVHYTYDVNLICNDPYGQFRLLQAINDEQALTALGLEIKNSSYLVTSGTSRENHARVTVWKFNIGSMQFERHQKIYDAEPIYLTSVSSPYGDFIAIVYGHVPKTREFGKIAIKRFDEDTEKFINYQMLTNIKSPVQAEFVLLPSQELILEVISENFVSFDVYIYEGASGFNKKLSGSALPKAGKMRQFTNEKGHYVVLRDPHESHVIKAVFKGEREIL